MYFCVVSCFGWLVRWVFACANSVSFVNSLLVTYRCDCDFVVLLVWSVECLRIINFCLLYDSNGLLVVLRRIVGRVRNEAPVRL